LIYFHGLENELGFAISDLDASVPSDFGAVDWLQSESGRLNFLKLPWIDFKFQLGIPFKASFG
jgi:hypothetical protein